MDAARRTTRKRLRLPRRKFDADHLESKFGVRDETGEDKLLVASPVFLVASVRSGTTMLRLMLDHHPGLAFFHEFHYVVEKLPESGWPELRDYYEFLKGDRIFLDSRVEIDATLDYPRLVNDFLVQKRERDRKPLVGATVHVHFDRLLRIWPDARFIHLLRDGRDVARSRVELGWAGNMYTGVQSWIDAERLWAKLVDEVPASRRMEVRYERLVCEPEAELARICEFLGLTYDPAMLSYDLDSTYSKPDAGLIDQWRRKLPGGAVRLAESRIGAMLVERGYELSDQAPIRIGPIGRWLIRVDDRWKRIRSRWRARGASLFVAESLMRALEPAYQSLTRFRWAVLDSLHRAERATLK